MNVCTITVLRNFGFLPRRDSFLLCCWNEQRGVTDKMNSKRCDLSLLTFLQLMLKRAHVLLGTSKIIIFLIEIKYFEMIRDSRSFSILNNLKTEKYLAEND